MSVLLLFIDGLGLGTRGQHNPLDGLTDATPLAVFENEIPSLPNDGALAITDARLGIAGRPQSASGQTTILTGINAPAAIGYHKQGFPNQALLEIIRTNSIFLQLKNLGIEPNIFANTYTNRFFESRPRWISATTAAVEAAELQFNTLEDLHAGRSLFHDFTNRSLIERGEKADIRTPEEAADVLANIVANHRFTLYEYFMTDKAGHAQDFNAARSILIALGKFITQLLSRIDLAKTTVVLTSDHGNIEDLSTRSHTLNPVPTMVWGLYRETAKQRITSLVDITPTIVSLLTRAQRA